METRNKSLLTARTLICMNMFRLFLIYCRKLLKIKLKIHAIIFVSLAKNTIINNLWILLKITGKNNSFFFLVKLNYIGIITNFLCRIINTVTVSKIFSYIPGLSLVKIWYAFYSIYNILFDLPSQTQIYKMLLFWCFRNYIST